MTGTPILADLVGEWGVPAEVCENCGEAYVDESATTILLDEIKDAAAHGVDVEVRRLAA